MKYTNAQPTFNLNSTWHCNFYVANGRLEWYIVEKPTLVTQTVDFPVSLPFDAVISRAWLSFGVGTPASGTALLTVNGQNGKDGEVSVEGVSGETTTLSVVFQFRANGAVYQDTQTHSGSMTITAPTLHIEYNSVSEGGGDNPLPDSDVVVSLSELNGVQLPRLLDKTFREVARITPDNLSISLKLHPLSTATMRMPTDGPDVKPRDFVELFTPHGSAGIFRASETSARYGHRGMKTVYLEHAFATLSDSLAIGTLAMSAPVATVISTLLNGQNEPLWALGDCEVPDDYELIYEYSFQNLLQAIVGVLELLPGDYALEFDTTRLPFLVHVRLMPDDDDCELRMNRNLQSAELTMDSSELCTRVIPFGAGEGTDRVTLTNLIGSQHMDSPNVDMWGYVSRTFTKNDIFDALTLRDVAQRYLDRHDKPLTSVTVDGMELYEATGETFDRFRLGRRCRLALPDYGLTMHERVIALHWRDVYGNPESVEVTLANRLRDASDEIAELMREATNSKLLGGSVETIEETSRAGDITPGSPYVQSFNLTGYGNVLNVRIAYTCTPDSGGSAECIVSVDGNEVDTSSNVGSTIDITRYLAADENGVPLVGEHKVRLQPKTTNTTTSTVSCTVTIKQINKR